MCPTVLSTVPYTWQVLNKYSESIFHPAARVILLDINQLSLSSSQSFSGFPSQVEQIPKFLPCPHALDLGISLFHLLGWVQPHLLLMGLKNTKHAPYSGLFICSLLFP